jgi:hypothetical protein
MGRVPSGACLPAAARQPPDEGDLVCLAASSQTGRALDSTIGHTFILLAPPRLQIIFRKCRRLGRQEVEKGSKMNSPNNLLFDSEMATSRLRKAFESAPESDLDDCYSRTAGNNAFRILHTMVYAGSKTFPTSYCTHCPSRILALTVSKP